MMSQRARISSFVRCESDLMSLVLFAVVFVAVSTTFLRVSGDDTAALQNTLSSLCSVNSIGSFASCCKSRNISSVDIANYKTWDCFIYELGSTLDNSRVITKLFVSLSFPFCFSTKSLKEL